MKERGVNIENFVDASAEDQQLVYKWRTSEAVSRYFIIDQISEEINRNWIKSLYESTPNTIAFIISRYGIKCGCVYFSNVDYTKLSAEYGIFLSEDAPKRQGIAFNSSILAIQYMRLKHGIRCFMLRVLKSNENAIALYKKLGFYYCKDDESIKKDGRELTIKKMMLQSEYPI